MRRATAFLNQGKQQVPGACTSSQARSGIGFLADNNGTGQMKKCLAPLPRVFMYTLEVGQQGATCILYSYELESRKDEDLSYTPRFS
jgi:hypothetical protein